MCELFLDEFWSPLSHLQEEDRQNFTVSELKYVSK